jgi:hypothetical protein
VFYSPGHQFPQVTTPLVLYHKDPPDSVTRYPRTRGGSKWYWVQVATNCAATVWTRGEDLHCLRNVISRINS